MKGVRLLDAYVARRFGLCVGLSIAGLVVVATLVDLIENVDLYIDYRARLADVALCYAYRTPYWIVLTLPIAGALGTLLALASLARHNEITAMKALGISLHRLLLPLFASAVAVSCLAFVLTDRVVPTATYRYNQRRDEITARSRADGSRRQVLLQDVGEQMLFVRAYDAALQRARDVAYERRRDGRLVERVHGALLEWRDGRWLLRDGHVYALAAEPVRGAAPDAVPAVLDTAPPGAAPRAARAPAADSTAPDIRPPQARATAISVSAFDTLWLDRLTLLPGDLARQQKLPEEMAYRELRQYIRRAEANGEDVARHRVDLHLKIAFPLTFVVIVALSAPLGASARRPGMAGSLGVGVIVCLVFYGCLKAAQALGWNQIIGPWAGAWAPNALFGAISVLLLYRAHK